MVVKLTKRAVDAIAPADRPIIVYDTDLKGFGIRVAPNGTLSWFVEYRPGAGGRRVAKKRIVIGSRQFTPERARQAAKEPTRVLVRLRICGDSPSDDVGSIKPYRSQ